MSDSMFMKPKQANVIIDTIDDSGNVIDSQTTGNLVVGQAKPNILDSLRGIASSNAKYFKLGRTVAPTAPADGDTGNTDASAFRKDLAAADMTRVGNTLTFNLLMDKTDGPDGNYTEATIHCANNQLFARVVFPNPRPKDPSVRLRVTWEIGY